MRISAQTTTDTATVAKAAAIPIPSVGNVVKQGSPTTKATEKVNQVEQTNQTEQVDSSEATKEKVQQAVHAMNDLLEANHNSSKFMYHEGLGRYYVTVVDKATEEVVKEIPPKKLLDAFYEMQKMVGMIVDEKI